SAKMAEMPAPSTQPGGQASGISSEEISSAPAAEAADAAPQAPGEPSSIASGSEMSKPLKKEGGAAAVKPEAAAKAEPKPNVQYLSADDSNSAASPVIARKLIRSGKYVQPAVIRTYEFLNYYSFSYPAPADKDLLIIPQMRALADGEISLQVAIRSRNIEEKNRKPFNITFLVDTSGSMAGEPEMLAGSFIRRFAGKLTAEDIISIVTFNKTAKIILDSHRAGAGTAEILQTRVFADLIPDNVTNIEEGLAAAFALAQKNYSFKYLNRVVVLSDGAANAGETAAAQIAKYAEDSDRQGIYLAGLGVGEGFNDSLMNTLTDKGRGAYLFIDSEQEIGRILAEPNFLANFDLALKNIRLKMVLPPGWEIVKFHGEQISTRAADIVPQYLSPNDQMIYHMKVKAPGSLEAAANDVFEFEAEYTPLQGGPKTASYKASAANMVSDARQIMKGDGIVAFAEMLKEIKYPLNQYALSNREAYGKAFREISGINNVLKDPELDEILVLCGQYETVIEKGEQLPGSLDKFSESIPAVLGIPSDSLSDVTVLGDAPGVAVKTLSRLGQSTRLTPMEGYKFLCVSNGPVEVMEHTGSSPVSNRVYRDPQPEFSGNRKMTRSGQNVFDLHQVVLKLKAPAWAKSFSFDFNFFSAEYPSYVNQNFNDTFYAILQAPSTNGGRTTNISFDALGNSIEVDNNYFENPFHPIPNTGTGYDGHGSTGWLRTSWPIQGGEEFTLTYSIHDEGDGIYDSMAVLDNFTWNAYPAAGTTDPLN
ncbi:MAG: VWA domain-containing protein, partial [Spirochaetales bacterium]